MSRRRAEPNAPAASSTGVNSAWFTGPWPAVLLGVVCYLNSLGNGFTYDDNAIVRDNLRIRDLTDLRGIWLTDWWLQPTDETPLVDPSRDRLYRPLTLQTFALNYALHGLNPTGFHLANVLLHAVACGLLWRLALRMVGDRAAAAVASIVFAVHPVHVEAVANIVGRAEILSTLFLLGGLLSLQPAAGRAGAGRASLAALCFLAALFAKETAICFPALIVVVLWNRRREMQLRAAHWLLHAGLAAAVLALYLPTRYFALEQRLVRDPFSASLFNPLQEAPWHERLIGPITIFGHYVRLLVAPAWLSCDYGMAIFDPGAGPDIHTAVGAAGLVALLAALVGLLRPPGLRRQLGVFAALLLASYVLISNTVLLIGVSLAERLMYWPSAPFAIGLGAAVVALWRRHAAPGGALHERAALFRTAGALLLAALALRTLVRNPDWRSDEALFRADIAANPNGAHLNHSLARILLWQARQPRVHPEHRRALLTEAEALLERTLRVSPRYADALQQRGLLRLELGQTDAARADLEATLLLKPMSAAARAALAALDGGGEASRQREAELLQQLATQPADAALQRELIEQLIAQGRYPEALTRCRALCAARPDDTAALRLLAEVLVLNVQGVDAVAAYRELLARDPDDWQAHANLATLIRDADAPGALHHAQRAIELQPDDLRTQVNYAGALALNGRRGEALDLLRRIHARLSADSPYRAALEDRITQLARELP